MYIALKSYKYWYIADREKREILGKHSDEEPHRRKPGSGWKCIEQHRCVQRNDCHGSKSEKAEGVSVDERSSRGIETSK